MTVHPEPLQVLTHMRAKLLEMEVTVSKIHSLCGLLLEDSENPRLDDRGKSVRLIEAMVRELKDALLEMENEVQQAISR